MKEAGPKFEEKRLLSRARFHGQGLIDTIGSLLHGLNKTYKSVGREKEFYANQEDLDKMVHAQLTHTAREFESKEEFEQFFKHMIEGSELYLLDLDELRNVDSQRDFAMEVVESIKRVGKEFFRWKLMLGVVSLQAWAIKDAMQMRKALLGSYF